MPEGQRLGTLCVHAGELEAAHDRPRPPIYTTTTFAFPSTDAILDVVEGRKAGVLYTCYGNRSIQGLEDGDDLIADLVQALG
jgi:cystathionine gamma-synthase